MCINGGREYVGSDHVKDRIKFGAQWVNLATERDSNAISAVVFCRPQRLVDDSNEIRTLSIAKDKCSSETIGEDATGTLAEREAEQPATCMPDSMRKGAKES